MVSEPKSIWRRYLPLLICIALGAGLGVWHSAAVRRGSNDPVTTALRAVTTPLAGAVDHVGAWFSGTWRWLFRGRALAHENTELRRKLDAMQAELNEMRELRERVDRLERLGVYVQQDRRRRLPARVVAFGPGHSVGTVVIDRGSRDGVRTGSVVVTPEGLVGHVMEVAATSAVVLVASDPRSSVGARVQRSRSRALGICQGLGGRRLRCSYLNLEADVVTGDIMVTSGLGGKGGIYPPGIVIGKVVSVTQDPAVSARTAVVEMAVDPTCLEEVVVLR